VREVPVKKLTVARGASISHDDESWDRVFYSIEAEVDEAELQVAKAELQGMINAWIVDALAHPLIPVSKAEEVEQIPRIDLAELEELPWTNYQTKQPAKPGEAGWIFSNAEGAEELVKALEARDGKLELAEYIFRFSGDKRFISRSPVKTKKNPGNGWERRDQTLKNVKEAGEGLSGQ